MMVNSESKSKSIVVLLAALVLLAHAATPPEEFDFVIVGSGATGSVLSTRFSNCTSKTILILEAGKLGSGQRDLGGTDFVAATFITNPSTGQQVLDPTPLTRYDVPIYTDTIRNAATQLDNMWGTVATGAFQAQARVVGGNMATNGMSWIHPYKFDFDAWNLPGFYGSEMWYYMKKIENATGTGFLNSPDRGYNGPIQVTMSNFVDQNSVTFRNACIAAGYNATGADPQNGNIKPSGLVSFGQQNTKRGVRQSSSVAYLAPALKAHPGRLQLRTSCTVTRVLFNEDNTKALGVEYVDEGGSTKTVNARLEVILATGALLTPTLLYNSGIGPLSILNAFHKPHVKVNEMIGQHVRNMQRFAMTFQDTTKVNPNFYGLPAQSIEYAENGDGIHASRGGWGVELKVNPAHPYNDVGIGSSIGVGQSPSDLYAQTFSISVGLSYNLYANGTVNLTSSNPLADFAFTANAYAVDEDVNSTIQGIFKARQIMQHWQDTSVVEVFPGAQYNTSAQLAPIVKANGALVCHFYSSVPMGLTGDYPLDTRFKVRGISNFRVVGPPAIPGRVSSGMQALACALGEKASDVIREDHRLFSRLDSDECTIVRT